MKGWLWVARKAVEAAHDRLLADYGGLEGIRDEGGLEGALACPRTLASYGDPDAAHLASLYACGIAQAHAFPDGNKRTAWATARAFLDLNAYDLAFEEADAVAVMLRVARNERDAEALAAWIRPRLVALEAIATSPSRSDPEP